MKKVEYPEINWDKTIDNLIKFIEESKDKKYEEPQCDEKGSKQNPFINYVDDEEEFEFLRSIFTSEGEELVQDPLTKNWCRLVIKENNYVRR